MLERRKEEIELLRREFGEVDTGDKLEWIIIRQFPLPPSWNKNLTSILVYISPGYPNTPPDNFYADNDLRVSNGIKQPGNTNVNQQHLGKAWLFFSFHVETADWQPHTDTLKGHNLLTFVNGIKKRLSEIS